jgi:hypothetical protein
MRTLNSEEITIGCIFGLCFFPVIGLLAMPLAAITGVLWALSGAGYPKILRRLGVPLAASLCVFLIRHHWQIFIAVPCAFGILSIGYGIPDSTDEGSSLGRFWTKLGVPVMTRVTIYVALAAVFIGANML